MEFEWDDVKNRSNFTKHGLSFEDAERVLSGPCAIFSDDRFSYGEDRFVALGLLAGRLVAIAYTERGQVTRIISMRKGTRREHKIYQERFGANRPDAR
jgi:uncharacterized DUF497 family protein